jgi:hypothetical protein
MLHRFLGILLIVFIAGAAYGQFPATGNKSRLGWQTTGDGLIYRGTVADTVTVKPAALANAYFLLDTVNAVLYRYIKTKQGWQRVDGGAAQQLGVGADGGNGATLYLSDTDEGGTSATVVVDNATAARLPWDGNAVIGILTVTTITHAVTITGTGLVTVTEVAAAQDGQIFLDVTIPAGHVDYAMLSQAVKDSIALGGTGETDLSFAGATSPVTLRSSTGDSVAFVAGDYITLAATDSTMTINSVTNLSVTQGASGETSVVVDNLTDVRLPWDGSAVVGVVESGSQTTIFLTVNGQQVQFDPIPNGDKGDIIVSDAGAVMMIDTAVVDWDNLTQALKDSILAAGEFNPVDSIQFVTTYEGTATTGKMIWNAQSGTVHLGMSGDIEMPLGQAEAHLVRNVTGSQIAKGKVVYISGATGQRPQISLADADAEMSSSATFGITAEAIDNNDSGFVFVSGYIKGINTSALTEGEALWLDTVPGGFTHDKPTAPVHSVLVGYVITKKNNGEIFVKVQNGYELGELHNVNTQGAIARDILRYNGSIWQPGKDTSMYNMDATLKGNRLISMGNADLQFRQAAGGADYVQIKKDFVLVGNTTTGNNAVVNQYGIKQDETGGNNAEIYMTGGQITMRGNTSADSIGLDPDLTIASSGIIKIRRSASGTVDSLYGKNSSGELLATKSPFAGGILGVANGGTGLSTFGGAGRVPYTTSANTLAFDTTFRVDIANGNFSWGDKSILSGSDNIILGNYGNIKTNTGFSNIILGRDAGGQNMPFANSNIIIGQGSAFALTNGDQNIILGTFSATDITTGSNNIILGHSIRLLNPNNNNQLNIGNTIFATGMDSTNLAIPRNGKVGILKNNPAASLHVGGKLRIDTLSSTPGALIALGTDSTIARLDPATYPTVTELSYVKGVTLSVQTQLNTKLNATDTASLSNRINLKLNISDTSAMLSPYLKKQDTISLSNRINLKLNISDTSAMLSTYINTVDTSAMLLPYLKKQDTISLSNRINLKLNISDTSAMLSTYINTVDTSAMLLPYLKKQDTISLSNRINAKLDTTDNSVKTKHITNGAVTSAKLADGAAGLAKLGGVKYITVDSVNRDISTELDTFSQIVVYLFIDSLSTGYDTITLPTPSATHAGKIVELYSDDMKIGGAPSMIVESSTNGIRFKNQNTELPTDYTILAFTGDTQLLYIKFVCMPHPRTGNYQWVGINSYYRN